jgi:hypothetical protein
MTFGIIQLHAFFCFSFLLEQSPFLSFLKSLVQSDLSEQSRRGRPLELEIDP